MTDRPLKHARALHESEALQKESDLLRAPLSEQRKNWHWYPGDGSLCHGYPTCAAPVLDEEAYHVVGFPQATIFVDEARIYSHTAVADCWMDVAIYMYNPAQKNLRQVPGTQVRFMSASNQVVTVQLPRRTMLSRDVCYAVGRTMKSTTVAAQMGVIHNGGHFPVRTHLGPGLGELLKEVPIAALATTTTAANAYIPGVMYMSKELAEIS